MKKSNPIVLFFGKKYGINQEVVQELSRSFEPRFLPKGKIILEPEAVENELRFVQSGFVREFYTTDTKEVNVNFFAEMEFITDMFSFHNNTKSIKWQETISEVELKVLPKVEFDYILTKYECGNSILESLLFSFFKQKEQSEFARVTKEPQELYQGLLENKSIWLNNIPQYHIASYLNVSPETLSRIRKRMVKHEVQYPIL